MLATAAANSDGLSGTDWVSVIVALIALVVSVISLRLTSLRRAKVEIDLVHERASLQMGGVHSDGRPTGPYVNLYLFIANSGASGTVVTHLDATDFHEDHEDNADGSKIWAGIARLDQPLGQPLTLALEREDAKAFPCAVHLAWSTSAPVADAEDYARRLRSLRSVTFTLRWEWRRAKFPNVRRRETAPGSQVITVKADQFRHDNIAHWRSNEATTHLAGIAQGREPEAD